MGSSVELKEKTLSFKGFLDWKMTAITAHHLIVSGIAIMERHLFHVVGQTNGLTRALALSEAGAIFFGEFPTVVQALHGPSFVDRKRIKERTKSAHFSVRARHHTAAYARGRWQALKHYGLVTAEV